MIYDKPGSDAPIDQGDLIEGCPILIVKAFHPDSGNALEIDFGTRRVVVLTQTCYLANEKVSAVNVAEVHDAQTLVEQRLFKAAAVFSLIRKEPAQPTY